MIPGKAARPTNGKMPVVDVVDIAAVASRLQVERATVDQWRRRDVMPAPDWPRLERPLWLWSTIELWARETGRLVRLGQARTPGAGA